MISFLRRAIVHQFRSPGASLFTWAAISLITFLAASLLLLLTNLELLVGRDKNHVEFQVYWQPGTDSLIYTNQWEQLKKMPGLISLKSFTPAQALESLVKTIPQKDKPDLQSSILPPTAILSIQPPQATKINNWAKATMTKLKGIPQVESVHYDPLQVDFATSWKTLSKNVLWPLLGFFMLILALLVANTVKFSFLQRQQEIEILRLVGASRAYIRGPIALGSALIGLIGGVTGLSMLKVAQNFLYELLYFPPLWIKIQFLPFQTCLHILAATTFLALISSLAPIKN